MTSLEVSYKERLYEAARLRCVLMKMSIIFDVFRRVTDKCLYKKDLAAVGVTGILA